MSVDNKFLVRDKITLKVTGLGSSGEGVGKTDGFTVFAHGALADETVEVELEQVKKNYASGKVTAILEASPERVEPLCPVYEACGGCQLQHLNYTGQLKAKEQQVRDALFRIGHLQEVKVLPIIGEEDPWHYRNKMQFPVAFENGILEIGCTILQHFLWIILFLSFLTEDQKRLPLDLKIILLQRKCQKLGLSAVQESCHQIYHNIRLSHFSFSLSFSFRLFHLK